VFGLTLGRNIITITTSVDANVACACGILTIFGAIVLGVRLAMTLAAFGKAISGACCLVTTVYRTTRAIPKLSQPRGFRGVHKKRLNMGTSEIKQQT